QDLDRGHGAEGAGRGRAPGRHRAAHQPRHRAKCKQGDRQDRAPTDRGRQSDAHPAGAAAVRWAVLILAMAFGSAALAQDVTPKKKKKPAQKTELKAHQKPTAEQIRKFNELEKKK